MTKLITINGVLYIVALDEGQHARYATATSGFDVDTGECLYVYGEDKTLDALRAEALAEED